jgi:hypothetical protein
MESFRGTPPYVSGEWLVAHPIQWCVRRDDSKVALLNTLERSISHRPLEKVLPGSMGRPPRALSFAYQMVSFGGLAWKYS